MAACLTVVHASHAGGMRADADGTPRVLCRLESRSYQGTPEEAARRFLSEHAEQLRLGTATLATEAVITAPGGTHVRLRQLHAGIPVYRSDIVVSLTSRNQVGMVVNNSRRNFGSVQTRPSISADEAIQAARSALRVTGRSIGKADEASLVAFEDSVRAWHLAYRVLMTNEEPYGDWETIVDARTGEILQHHDRFVMHTGGHVQGAGHVYLQDPLTAARRMYGSAGFTDNNDADSDSLTHYRTPVVLDSLCREDSLYVLRGPYCTVTEIESPADPLFYSAPSPDEFSFTRSQQAFEAVNVYYHVSTACRYFESLGFSAPRLREIRLDPHGFQGQDNSHYSPSGNWISWGEGGVDDAEDADVIWHEYGHAIQFAQDPAWGGGECGAVGEGISDYWAASYARTVAGWQPGDYHYQWLFNWDGHNPFWAGRILDDQRTYPFGAIPIHSAGQIVSAGLMGVHASLGREITDRLVLKALCYLGSGVLASDFAAAVIQADLDIYDGTHLAPLVYWLGTVKHFIDPEQYAASVPGEVEIPAGMSLGRNYPNPFNPSTTIPFTLAEPAVVRLMVFDVTGRKVVTLMTGETSAGVHRVRWDGGTDEGTTAGSGVYFYRLCARGAASGRLFVAAGSMLLLK